MRNDGCVLVNEASAVLLAAEGHEQLSPARSSVLELIRAYVWLRNSAGNSFGYRSPINANAH